MKGVAVSVSQDLRIYDLTHEIPAYNIWEASYRLQQAASFWPSGTVFVSVVDPGVGSDRRSVVMKSKSGHYFVTPDNGTLTLVAETLGISGIRIIDEQKNRLPGSGASYTFHGRDVYAYTGARLAAGVIRFDDVGPVYNGDIVQVPYQKPSLRDDFITGTIDILDVQYGNLWTNIDKRLLDKMQIGVGSIVLVKIYEKEEMRYKGDMLFGNTFSDVTAGEPVAYLNSLLNFSVALNMGNFASRYHIGSGPAWRIELRKIK
jgi:S-adenosylmethionine hydrolase